MIAYYTDYAFLFVLAMFSIATIPTRYAKINLLLTGKFLLFIGIHKVLVYIGATDGISTDIYRAVLDLCFMWLFWKAKGPEVALLCAPIGEYLAFLCGTMALFHLSNTVIQLDPIDYTLIMVGFQILQLMAAGWGLIDGIHNRYSVHHSSRGFSKANIHRHKE